MNNAVDLFVKLIPSGPEMVTVEWMNQALRGSKAVQGAAVSSLEISDYKIGNGMAAHISRFRLNYDREAPYAPRTIIAKFSISGPFGRYLGIYEREVRFYGEIAPGLPLRSPKCYYAAYDPESGRSILLLEDLAGFQNGHWSEGCTPDQARQGVKEIALLHAPFWGNPQFTELEWLFKASTVWPNGLAQEAAVRWEAFCKAMELPPSGTVKRAGELVIEKIDQVAKDLSQSPVTLVHNDYQLDNLFFGEEDGRQAIVIADWALLSRGKGAAEVSYFLCGSLSPEDRRSCEIDLLKEYLVDLEKGGARGYSFEQALADYQKAAIVSFWRMIYAIGGDASDFMCWSPIVGRYLTALADFYL